MPKTADEIFRDFVRFTGDGKPDAPVGKPLPRGDERSGVHNPSKADFREWANGFGVTFDETLAEFAAFSDMALAEFEDALSEFDADGTAAITRVDASIDRLDRTDQKGLWSNSIATLRVDNSYTLTPGSLDTVAIGDIIQTRREGYTYEVVASGGHVVTAGGIHLRVAQKPRVTLRAYGAVGDGVANDAAVIGTAVADARARGMILSGEGLTYRIGSQLTAIPGVVEDFTIDASGITSDLAWNVLGPAFEASKPITASAVQGARQINVTAHGYSVGDVVLALSDMILETGTNSVCAHWAEVVSTTTNTMTLSHALLCNLQLANNPRVHRLPRVGGARLSGVTVIGSASCPGGIQIVRLDRPRIDNLRTINCEVRGLSINQCFMPATGTVWGEKCDRAGLGYAINVSGCGWAEIGETFGRRCRHVMTWGAVTMDGGPVIPCTGGSHGSVIGSECVGSVFDTHPGVLGVWQRSGIVLGDMAVTTAGQDAITMQAAGGSCRAKITGTGHRHVCLVQTFHNAAAFQSFPSIEVDIEGDTAAGQLVLLDVVGSMGLRTASIVARGSASGESAFVRVADGSAIGSVTIDGRGVSSGRAVLINQQVSGQISYVRVSGSWRAENNTVSTVQVIGPTSTGTVRANISVAGMDASGGAYGLRLDNRADAKGASIAFLSGFTSATFTSGGATIA